VIAEIATARQPDAPFDDGQVTTQSAEMCRVARVHLKGPAMKHLELRVHHQSPALGVTMIVVVACAIQ